MAPTSLVAHLLLSLSAPTGTPKPARFVSSDGPGRFPPPPWSFVASRIHYQFRLVRESAAKRTVPCRPSADDGGSPGVSILSLGGWTLGGLFAVEYESSPVGPYREVAVLSGLVARGLWPFPGAWSSHIFVNSEDAAEAGREIWGLPASVVSIDFDSPMTASSSGNGDADGEEVGKDAVVGPEFVLSKEGISLVGWTSPGIGGDVRGNGENLPFLRALDVTLPSYSGRLEASDPLLRYPLTISGPESIVKGPAGVVKCSKDMDAALRSIVCDSAQLFALNVGRVLLTAGVPDTVS